MQFRFGARPAPSATPRVASPCIRICELDDDGVCRGCFRTLGEIASWGSMDDAGRLRVLTAIAQRKPDGHALP
ncbi:MAG: DUF1289 domain-containing protein [Gemmatimonadales bacterium]|nr:DUF1289 domain-containing protein [Gemmatimonadales bacterium]